MAASLSEDGLPQWKRDFLKACTDYSALSFGTFTLKSGRISPYFFNAGIFHRASAFRILTGSFAHAIASHEPVLNFDVVFGPAYKGIPLAAAVIDKLAQLDEKRFGDVSYSFNRKEVKTHGDGGSLVGSPLAGKRILIVDDVITAGTAIREAIDIIRANGGTLAGIVVALDRMEKMPTATDDDGEPGPSTIGAVRKEYGIPVVACLTLDDIIEGFKSIGNGDDVKRMEEYRSKYRAVD